MCSVDYPNLTYSLQSGEEVTLGRDPQCDVRVRLPAVSRVHCKIIEFEGKVGYFFCLACYEI